ncbi:MAG TPA: EF-P beta-lysylation protein EpmB [Lacipirellulaceae bacterium]|nr:EF-P beta-lysylation protein EpmB [Lacipirellulaceae bacterium]
MTILSTPAPAVRPRFNAPQYGSWQDAMKDAVRDVAELCRILDLPSKFASEAIEATRQFRLFVPRGFISRMRPGDPKDPLLRQVLPVADEILQVPGYIADPVRDKAAERQAGLLQKYRGRVLLIAAGSCAVHCRYCFRRHFPYQETPRSPGDWQPVLDEIAADVSLREVILSGGDPLTLVDDSLHELIQSVVRISHLRRLRIHTRLPIVIPERVTDELVEMLAGCGLTPLVVLHANHANELDETVATAIAKLADAGIVLLNQAVLLAGVNDSTEAQAALCERLIDLRVMPYYLHQLDHVAGAAHFEIPIARGRRIIHELRERLPGYAVPRFVAEVPGAASKTILE